jgi:hypothetical protein
VSRDTSHAWDYQARVAVAKASHRKQEKTDTRESWWMGKSPEGFTAHANTRSFTDVGVRKDGEPVRP